MPIYRYSCGCGKQYDEFRKIDNRNNCPTCICGQLTEMRIMPTSVQADNTDYMSVALDKETGKRVPIQSRRQHREFLARNDYVEVGNDFKPPKQEDHGDAPMLSADEMKRNGFVEEAY
jgi:hypothetical protein